MVSGQLAISKRQFLRGFDVEPFGRELRVRFDYNVAKLQYVRDWKFKYNSKGSFWFLTDIEQANKFVQALGSGEAEKWIEARRKARLERAELSRAADSGLEIPAPSGFSYIPYQKGGIAFGWRAFQERKRGILLGDEMGLGKTIQAAGFANLAGMRRIIIICPASLRGNWYRELQRWLLTGATVGIADSKRFPATDVVIINYDIVHKWEDQMKGIAWDLVICDEVHKLKNPGARRTQVIFGRKDPKAPIPPLVAKFRLLLTGTPILNRPEEIFGIVNYVCPEEFPSRRAFEKKYKDATNVKLNELQEALRSTCMIRRLKMDVLTELPPKMRQVLEVPGGKEALAAIADEKRTVREQKQVLEDLRGAVAKAKGTEDDDVYREAVRRLRAARGVAFSEIARVRKATAIAKLPYVIAHIEACFEEGHNKMLCFAHHHEVIESLLEHFDGTAVAIYGKTKNDAFTRQGIVDTFQTDPEVRLFIGSIGAAGVGLTLTASSHVMFAELDWVPGNIMQAEDRAHRIGQRDSVLVQHLVLEGSLDALIASRIVEKAEMIDAALDRDAEEISAKKSFASKMLDGILDLELTEVAGEFGEAEVIDMLGA